MKIRFSDAKFAKESEKAVAFKVVIDYEYNASSSLGRSVKRNALIWIPRSQLDADGNPAEWIWRKNIKKAAEELNPFNTDYGWGYGVINVENPDLKPFKTEKELAAIAQKEKNFESAGDFREELVKKLKEKGAKGVHNKMKNRTLLEKANEYGVDAQKIAEKFNYNPKLREYNFNTGEYELREVFEKLNPIKSSVAIENSYKKRLVAFTKQINKSIKRWAIARLSKGDGTPAKQLTFELNALNEEWTKKASEWGKGVANGLNKEVSGYVDLNLQNQLKNTLLKNSKPLHTIKNEKVSNALASAYERNLYLIKSIPQKTIDDFRQGFLNAISNFDREALKKMALNYEGISVRRAKFIARDQTAKAIQSYNQARAESLGFEYYQWVTSKDERVSTGKGGHIHLDGRIYKYSEPTAIIDSYGTKGHTGQRPNCRCEAIAILPSFTQELKRVKDSSAGDYYILTEKK